MKNRTRREVLMIKRVMLWIVACALLLASWGALPQAQAQGGAQGGNAAITLNVTVGFDGRFRDLMWAPVFVRVENNGTDVVGRLVVRPSTSGDAVEQTYSTPIELPSGARKSVILYVIPRARGQNLRVDLLNQSDVVLSSSQVRISSMLGGDRLHLVLTEAVSGSLDLTTLQSGEFTTYQANWMVENLPDFVGALDAVDMILVTDIDTGTLTAGQRTMLADWVAMGGHLIVTGGAPWEKTAAGLRDLLPFDPQASQTVPDLTNIAAWSTTSPVLLPPTAGNTAPNNAPALAVDPDAPLPLTEQTIIATGVVKSGAETLVSNRDGTPLIVRRTLGEGKVDYITADPNALPLRGWDQMPDLWFTLATSGAGRIAWANNVHDWQNAAQATQIIPGYNFLPNTAALCGFLMAYIILIGPVNYMVLRRLNRREWAWVTIPVLILAFSALAWQAGFNLRGTEVTLNRLTVVRSWEGVDTARVEELTGILAPRRANYSLQMNGMVRAIPQDNLFSGTTTFGGITGLSADIQQTNVFRAADVPIDASFIAGFATTGSIARPNISGSATIRYVTSSRQEVRGSITNDSGITLTDGVILGRGASYRIRTALNDGDTRAFNFNLGVLATDAQMPAAAMSDRTQNLNQGYYYGYGNTPVNFDQTLQDMIGQNAYNNTGGQYGGYGYSYGYQNNLTNSEWQQTYRIRTFLDSFLQDRYGASGRGDRLYFVGWSDQAVLDEQFEGAGETSLNTTVYIIELDTTVDLTNPEQGDAFISGDRFTWAVRSSISSSRSATAPFGLNVFGSMDIVYRYTPLPDARLTTVTSLDIMLQGYVDSGFELQLWDWEDQVWRTVNYRSSNNTNVYTFSPSDDGRFIGPNNAVEIRINGDNSGQTLNVNSLVVTQRGRY
jgi:hypothetical protein